MDLLKDQMRLQPSRIEEVVQVSCSGGGVREERLEDWFLVIGAGLPRTGTSSLKKAISMLTGVQVWLSLKYPMILKFFNHAQVKLRFYKCLSLR